MSSSPQSSLSVCPLRPFSESSSRRRLGSASALKTLSKYAAIWLPNICSQEAACQVDLLRRRGVDGDRLGCRDRDSLAQLARSEHLRLRAVGEQGSESMFEPLELRDHRRPLTVLDDTGCAEVSDLPPWDADGDLDPRSAPLERFGPTGPRGGEVEASWPSARLGALPRRDDPRYAVDPLLAPALREQIPDPGFEDEPEGVEAPRDDRRALLVTDLEPTAAPKCPCDHGQVRDSVLLAEPAARVDVEQSRGPPGALLQVGRQ